MPGLGLAQALPFRSGRENGPASPIDIIQWLEGGPTDGYNQAYRVQTVASNAVVSQRTVLTFDGVGDVLTIPDNSMIRASNTMWVQAWVRFGTISSTDDKTIVHTGSNGANTQFSLFADYTSSKKQIAWGIGSAAIRYGLPEGFNDQLWCLVEGYTDGTSANSWITVNGVACVLSTGNDRVSAIGNTPIWIGKNAYITSSPIQIAHVRVGPNSTTFREYAVEEGSGLTVHAVGNYSVNGTITSTSGLTTMWAQKANGIPTWNGRYGYDRYTHATTADILVPHKSDGSSLVITPPTGYTKVATVPGGYVHNNGGWSTVQTDASVFGAGVVNFYSANGTTLDNKTYQTLYDHWNTSNGLHNFWVRVDPLTNLIEWAIQYRFDKEWVLAEYLRNLIICGGNGGAVTEGGEVVTSNGFVVWP